MNLAVRPADDMGNWIETESAPLPALYENAQRAMAECSRIDECQQWANKAEAMASYAKQANDETLRKMADRIQARAIRRCGELLKQIAPAYGANQNIQVGAVPKVTRESAAMEAGLSERQRKTALRVAAVPQAEFEAAVESDDPPTVTQLADAGKQAKPPPRPLVDLGGIDPAQYPRATELQGAMRRLADYCNQNDPIAIARAFQPHEVAGVRRHIASAEAWLDRFIVNLS